MVVALVLLAIAMIAGGTTAAAFGWDIVLLERGWVMVIAGSGVAATGALILAVAAAVSRLGRIRRELEDLSERLARNEVPLVAPAPSPPAQAPSAPPAKDAKAGPQPGEEPPLPLFMQAPREDEKGELPPGLVADSIDTVIDAQRDREDAKPAPSLTLVESDTGPEKPEPASVVPLFPDRVADHKPEKDAVARKPGDETGADEEDAVAKVEGKDAPAAGDRDPPPPAAPRDGSPDAAESPEDGTVIGSYTSGDNRYVMFADGSISAHTPTGVFRFASLDELKEFIASGGEGASHG